MIVCLDCGNPTCGDCCTCEFVLTASPVLEPDGFSRERDTSDVPAWDAYDVDGLDGDDNGEDGREHAAQWDEDD